MKKQISLEEYVLEQMREYVITGDVKVESKEDVINLYDKMYKEGYFFQADMKNALEEVKQFINEFANCYEKDASVLEKDLVFFGPHKTIEKMEALKKAPKKVLH